MLSEKQMSLLVALKIAGIKAEVATDVLHVLENENQAKELEAFVVANKPLSEKALLAKVTFTNNHEATLKALAAIIDEAQQYLKDGVDFLFEFIKAQKSQGVFK